MGVDVYTPAYRRLHESPEYKAIRARYDAWCHRPTVEMQNWTDDDTQEYDAITAIRGRMEIEVGNFRHRAPFCSTIGPIVAFESGASPEDSWGFSLDHEQVGQYLAEWRRYLRECVACGKHLDKYVNGFNEPAPSPFDSAVRRFKNWCLVYQLGEGCDVA